MFANLRRTLWVAALALTTAGLAPAPALAASPAPSPSATQSPAEPPAAGPNLASFGIAPAGIERPDDRPYLRYSAAPGSVIYDHVALLNQAGTPIDLQLYSGDVIMAGAGGLAVPARGEKSTDAGSWITLDAGGPQAHVPAQTTAGVGYTVLPFSITIPANAQPGDHVGGIVGSLVAVGQAGQNTPSIDLEQRVVARVYIRVAGPLKPGLVVTDVTASFRPGSLFGAGAIHVEYTLRNSGNVRMAVTPAVQVAGPFGLLAHTTAGDRVDELLPGGQAKVSTSVSGVWPLGLETVTVLATGLPSATGENPGVGTVRASTHVWALSWLVGFLLALVLGLGVLREVRRRRRGRAGGATRGRRVAAKGAQRTVPTSPAPEPASVTTAAG
jgi:hypothetical protein